jgi:hypothetical protein
MKTMKTRPGLLVIGALALIAAVPFVAGCGPDRPETVPVQGVVTFAGEPPPAPGIVNFQPVETTGDLPKRPGSGPFDTDGHFEVTSFDGTHGLIPGRYRVTIECLAGQPAPVPGGYEEASYVPAGFQPPELIVEADGGPIDDLRYDVPPKR